MACYLLLGGTTRVMRNSGFTWLAENFFPKVFTRFIIICYFNHFLCVSLITFDLVRTINASSSTTARSMSALNDWTYEFWTIVYLCRAKPAAGSRGEPGFSIQTSTS